MGRTSRVRAAARPLDSYAAHRPPTVRACPRSMLVSAIEFFFDTLLVLVCLGVIAFSALAVKKLYQGQR